MWSFTDKLFLALWCLKKHPQTVHIRKLIAWWVCIGIVHPQSPQRIRKMFFDFLQKTDAYVAAMSHGRAAPGRCPHCPADCAGRRRPAPGIARARGTHWSSRTPRALLGKGGDVQKNVYLWFMYMFTSGVTWAYNQTSYGDVLLFVGCWRYHGILMRVEPANAGLNQAV